MNEKSIILKKVFIEDINNTNDGFSIEYIKIIKTKNEEEKIYDARDKLSKNEWKALIFGTYKNNIFKMKDKLKIEYDDSNGRIDLNINDIVILKDGPKRIIGRAKIERINDDKLILKELEVYTGHNNFNSDINSIFRFMTDNELNTFEKELDNIIDYYKKERNKENKNRLNRNMTDKELNILRRKIDDIIDIYKKSCNKEEELKKYVNGLFKINYLSCYYYFKYFFVEDKDGHIHTLENKFSAYCSYLAIKDVFKSLFKDKYVLSQLDSFVKKNKYEYDALLIKTKSDERLFDMADVFSTIEIKTSGYFKSKNDESLIDNFEKYNKNQHIEGKQHIYIAVSESVNYYFDTYSVLKVLGDNYVGIFCKFQIDNEKICIPLEYDLEKLMKLIKI